MTLQEHHHDHRDVSGGPLRPVVFGFTDGLISNSALVMGVIGGHGAHHTVAIAGCAGLVSGAFSMAIGELVSVRSQRELTEAEIDIERLELRRNPEAERLELVAVYERRGVEHGLAVQVVEQLTRDPEITLRTHVMEELGVDPDNLPSARLAAGASLVSFAIGALLPLLPVFLGTTSVWVILGIAALGLGAAGVGVASTTNTNKWQGALRQMVLGLAAATITFGLGRFLGVAIN